MRKPAYSKNADAMAIALLRTSAVMSVAATSFLLVTSMPELENKPMAPVARTATRSASKKRVH